MLSLNEKISLVKRNTDEIIGEDSLKELLEKKEQPVVYWGTAPTGKPHIGYMLPAIKISDFLKAGFKVKILLADLHAALDNVPWLVLEKRYEYYSKIIPFLIEIIGVDIKNLEIIKGSDFQLKPEYMFDVLRLSSFVSVKDANKAASEVVKNRENPKLSGLLYPLMQVIDEVYLNVDAQLGGTDQRKIMVLAREGLPKLGYDSRIEILNPLIPGLIQGGKMSSSLEESKIDLLDSPEEVIKKLNKAYCLEGDLDNGILPFVKYVIMVLKKDNSECFTVKRSEKFGGDLKYYDYDSIEKDFISKNLHPQDLKFAVANEINLILKNIQKNKDMLESIAKDAYS